MRGRRLQKQYQNSLKAEKAEIETNIRNQAAQATINTNKVEKPYVDVKVDLDTPAAINSNVDVKVEKAAIQRQNRLAEWWKKFLSKRSHRDQLKLIKANVAAATAEVLQEAKN